MENQARTVAIHTDCITLGQLLKFAGLVQTGGEAKARIEAGEVRVNGAPCAARGHKLFPGDRVTLGGQTVTVGKAPA